MNTTLLFVELLIIGLQVLLWIGILIADFFGYKWLSDIVSTNFSNWEFVIILFAVSFVYILGTIFDRVADILFSKWDGNIKRKMFPDAPVAVSVIRFELGKDNDYLNRQFEYARSRMRISRASAINFALICITLLILIARFLDTPNKWNLFVFILVFGVIATASSIFAWYRLTFAFLRLVRTNYDLYLKRYGAIDKAIRKTQR